STTYAQALIVAILSAITSLQVLPKEKFPYIRICGVDSIIYLPISSYSSRLNFCCSFLGLKNRAKNKFVK
ncbi:MAG: hypothetical protein RR735_09725, partial [Bacteroidales bacterium]